MAEKLKDIKRIIICPVCHDLFSNSVILPCVDRIYRDHLPVMEMKQIFTCVVCNEESCQGNKGKHFSSDQLLILLLELNLHENVFLLERTMRRF